MRGWVAAVVLVVLLASSLPAGAQQTAPPVEIEDAGFPGLVVPLGDEAETEIEVRVGCEAGEAPGTATQVHLQPVLPEWVNLVLSPSVRTWSTGPADCPSSGTPFVGNVTAIVSLTQAAPAYEEVDLPLEATVVKEPPADAGNRTYGPFEGTLSVTPGYFHLHNARITDTSRQIAPGGEATFEATIDNFANHESRFTVAPSEVPDEIELAVEPEAVRLAPNETDSFAVQVDSSHLSIIDSQIVSVELTVQGNSTHELGGEGGTSTETVQIQLTPLVSDPRDSPWSAGLAIGLVGLVVAGIVLHRRR